MALSLRLVACVGPRQREILRGVLRRRTESGSGVDLGPARCELPANLPTAMGPVLEEVVG
jgi:hypothetical protein